MSAYAPALLALADGSVFHGKSIGAETVTTGEVVFNTAMTGYQEILTDPSYTRQIVTLTYPHIGNTGINMEDVEAGRIFAAGAVVSFDGTRDADGRRGLRLFRGRVGARAIGPHSRNVRAGRNPDFPRLHLQPLRGSD